MDSEKWHDILTLLSVVILVDNRVYKEEVDAFIETVADLNDIISPEIFMTPNMAFEWFKSNRQKIRDKLQSDNGPEHTRRLIEKCKHLPGKKAILEAMVKIAKADDEYHSAEHGVIRDAAKAWMHGAA